jgi:hypothetical protein
MGSMVCVTRNDPAGGRFFPPAVALYVVKLACERPDVVGRSLAQWDSVELARQLVHDGVVDQISPQTVQRILAHHKLKPWRHHLWLSPKVPRDAAFAAQVQALVTLYTRPLGVWERVLCVDEQGEHDHHQALHNPKGHEGGRIALRLDHVGDRHDGQGRAHPIARGGQAGGQAAVVGEPFQGIADGAPIDNAATDAANHRRGVEHGQRTGIRVRYPAEPHQDASNQAFR